MLNKLLQPIFNLVRFHKRKMALLLGLYVFFMYFLFPFNDLGDLVSTKISEATQGQVFVDFDNIDLSLVPHPGLALSKVTIETPFAPALTAKSLSVAPSILGLLSFRPGVNVHASGFLGGSLDMTAGVGDKTQTTPSHRKQKISLDMSELSLSSMAKLASLPLRFDGAISGSLDSQVDPDFSEQPTADLDLQASKTVIPEGNINTPLGPIGLPRLNMGDVIIQGHADKGQIEISKLVAGRPGGDLYATATGRVDLKMSKSGGSVQPQVGAYDLTVKLQVGESVKQKLGSFLGILQNYQTTANTYAFRVSAPNTFSPPNLTKSSGP
jgi:type II secretion system protein N